MRFLKQIRDPIHGNIGVTKPELKLIDTRHFQRLRNIKQNGFCYLVYPAMNSSRFEHCLGSMHLAGRVSQQLDLAEEDAAELRIAALLHDIGHYPFSHTVEGLRAEKFLTHEQNTRRLLLKTELRDLLAEEGFEAEDVWKLISGKGCLGKVIASQLDVDRMDYLIRDSYYAGVAYGIIDLDRIIQGLKLIDGKVVVDRGSLEAVEALLISRNLMYQTVYRHHTKRIVERMFREALIRAAKAGRLSFEEFVEMDDISLISKLRSSEEPYVRDVMRRIDERRLFKKFCELKVSSLEEKELKEARERQDSVELEICEDFEIEEGYVLLDLPDLELAEFEVLVEFNGEVYRIDEVSALARSLEADEREKLSVCFYTLPEHLERFRNFDPLSYLG